MVIEELFSKGMMKMGPSARYPARQVGVFEADLLPKLVARRSAEMMKFAWIAGEWRFENHVPATRSNPAYVDIGKQTYSMRSDGWICLDGAPQITFDPFSGQWIYALLRGAYGVLRSTDGLEFRGSVTMLGIDCEWRMTWTPGGPDEFRFVNEELADDGSRVYVDEWQFFRATPPEEKR